ncbi:hypothetical protein [Maribacter luteus]|uniref:Uncharacterized protein n=1 Tax=Maribacter luteus TaxID=2594478 RepID=A0A6I2MHC7_9FLAO|nr:hypothetical protein [Maribacter luteus]MRX63271.1 hypothetical protein [Maribacter luteus]
MSRLRIGFRSVFKKKYEIELFDFLLENTDEFNIPFTGLDLWNSKKSDIKVLQVEKRIEYFHFMYIPIFPIGKIWTLRKKDGKLYDINSVKYKIESRIKKTNYPIYTFSFPILIFLSISTYLLITYGKFYYRDYKSKKSKQEKILVLKEKLNKLNPPFYLIINQNKSPSKSFRRVDSIVDEVYYLSKLPKKLDTFTTSTLDNVFYSTFAQNKLVRSKISKNNLDTLISNINEFRAKRLVNILTKDELEAPKLEIDFHIHGLSIINNGKPITFEGYIENNNLNNQWVFPKDSLLLTGKRIDASYIAKKNGDTSNLTLLFTDSQKSYKYQVIGTYINSQGTIAFIDKSIKKLN